MRVVSKTPAPDAVDPALVPFLDAISEILVAQEVRLAEARRALCDAARSLPVDEDQRITTVESIKALAKAAP